MKKSKILNVQEYKLPIAIQEEEEGGFTALCSVWKECYAQGETLEEVINEISYVASSLIELYREENINIPLKLKRATQKTTKGFTLNVPLIVSTS